MRKYGFLIIGIFIGAVVVGPGPALMGETGWWQRFTNRHTKGETEPQKPLVEPHADVLKLQDSFAQVAEAVKPAVVNIAAVQITRVQSDPHEFFFGDPNEFFYRYFGQEPQPRYREYRREGTGSGVIIDPEGYILTNNHVVQEAQQLTVTLADGKSFKGSVVGTDPRSDMAVIRIKGPNPFPYVPLGDSSKVRIGDWVLAVGSPFGLEQTVTAGIVSAIRQSLTIEGKSFSNLLQTDAAINRGNSGGPLVNLRGEVVGINTAIYAPTGVFSGIGFAIPVNKAKSVLADLIEKGYVERSWIGVEIAKLDDVLADQFGLPSADGALVNNVLPNAPADKAGLKRGDVIIEFDGKKVTTVESLQDIVAQTPPGKAVVVKIFRGGDQRTLKLKTALMPGQSKKTDGDKSPPEKPERVEWLGAFFSDLTDALRQRYGLEEKTGEDLSGAVVIEVPPTSVAAEAGLREGDLVKSINRMPVQAAADLEKVSKKVSLKDGVVLDVLREGRLFYLSYKSLQ